MITLSPAQERRRRALEKKLQEVFRGLRELATEVSGDPDPDLFFEADGDLCAMEGSFRYEDPDRTSIWERTDKIIVSIKHGIGSGAW